jgi:hypothetical protein
MARFAPETVYRERGDACASPDTHRPVPPAKEDDMKNGTMKTMKTWQGAAILMLGGAALAACDTAPTLLEDGGSTAAATVSAALAGPATVAVSGSAVHFFSTAVVHSQEPTEAGMIQRSTDIVRLTGDLDGYLVFHATSRFDFASGALVNTGTQLFSGTIAGSDPVLLHDDRFRFDVDLATGETLGSVHLGRSNDSPHKGAWYECDLTVVGTGVTTPEGDGVVEYSGECVRRGQPR